MSEVNRRRRGFSIGMLDTHRRHKAHAGKTLYEVMVRINRDGYVAKLPDAQSVRVLAQHYLDSEYEEQWRGKQSFGFLIDAHVPKVCRDIFLYKIAESVRLVPLSRRGTP